MRLTPTKLQTLVPGSSHQTRMHTHIHVYAYSPPLTGFGDHRHIPLLSVWTPLPAHHSQRRHECTIIICTCAVSYTPLTCMPGRNSNMRSHMYNPYCHLVVKCRLLPILHVNAAVPHQYRSLGHMSWHPALPGHVRPLLFPGQCFSPLQTLTNFNFNSEVYFKLPGNSLIWLMVTILFIMLIFGQNALQKALHLWFRHTMYTHILPSAVF